MATILSNRQPGKKPNTWDLTWADYVEATCLASESPDGSTFFDALLKARFEPIPLLTDAGKLAACQQAAAGAFAERDHAWIKQQLAKVTSAVTFDAVSTATHDLFRGYSESDRSTAIANAEVHRKRILILANQSIADNQAKRTKLGVHRYHVESYDGNIATLTAIVARATAKPATTIANGALAELAAERHSPGFPGSLRILPSTYEEMVIDGCDAARVTFPFRFLIHAPIRTYRELLAKWKTSGDAALVTAEIAAGVFTSEYADVLLTVFGHTPMAKGADCVAIKTVFEELREALLTHRLQTVTLLAVTQAEGMIWRYAEYLQSTKFSLYTINGHEKIPVLWDRAKVAPETDPSVMKRWKNKGLTSARALLERTRIEQVFRPNAIEFAIAEYADDRNGLAHGTLLADERLAVQAALLLGTILQCITAYENEGRPVRRD
jgi:hypothetical protein